MTPADIILFQLGNGPATETALVAHLMRFGRSYDTASLEVKIGLVELLVAKRIEQVTAHSIYRLSANTPMEKPPTTAGA